MPPLVKDDGGTRRTRSVLVLLLLLYVAGRILQLYADRVPPLLIVVLHVLPPAAFALLHGSLLYRLRGTLVFTILCLGSGTFFESLSLRTGFPFRHYYFPVFLGPRLSPRPSPRAPAHPGLGSLLGVLFLVIPGRKPNPPLSSRVVLLP